MAELRFPVYFGATRVQADQRWSGPPSKMLPALRDIATQPVECSDPVLPRRMGRKHSNPVVTMEVDTATNRIVGTLMQYISQSNRDETIGIRTEQDDVRTRALASIIAFRVVSVETEEGQ